MLFKVLHWPNCASQIALSDEVRNIAECMEAILFIGWCVSAVNIATYFNVAMYLLLGGVMSAALELPLLSEAGGGLRTLTDTGGAFSNCPDNLFLALTSLYFSWNSSRTACTNEIAYVTKWRYKQNYELGNDLFSLEFIYLVSRCKDRWLLIPAYCYSSNLLH